MTNTTIVELTIAQYDTLFAFEFLGSRACREKKDGNKMQDKSKKENFNSQCCPGPSKRKEQNVDFRLHI
jgi:hypothetical protein